jgi:hypothetical protein
MYLTYYVRLDGIKEVIDLTRSSKSRGYSSARVSNQKKHLWVSQIVFCYAGLTLFMTLPIVWIYYSVK